MRRLLESVAEKCVAFGFVGGIDAAVGGSTIEADANKERKGTPRVVENIWLQKEQVQRPVAEFLASREGMSCLRCQGRSANHQV